MKMRPTQCVPSRRSRRYGRAALSRAAFSRVAFSRAAFSRAALWIAAFALAPSSRSAAGTAPAAGAVPSVTDVAFHDGADVPIQALAFFPVVVLNADRAPPDAVRALAQMGSHPVARLAAQPRKVPDDLLGARGASPSRATRARSSRSLLVRPPPRAGRRAPSPRRLRRCAPSGRKDRCCSPPIHTSPSRQRRSFLPWS